MKYLFTETENLEDFDVYECTNIKCSHKKKRNENAKYVLMTEEAFRESMVSKNGI